MKAIYTKPLLAVENITLFSASSRDCMENSIPKDQLTFADPAQNCVWQTDSGPTIFSFLPTCTIPGGDSMGYGCYNNPGEGQYLFRS